MGGEMRSREISHSKSSWGPIRGMARGMVLETIQVAGFSYFAYVISVKKSGFLSVKSRNKY